MKDTVLFEVDEAIATITLNRPERLNAINPPLLEALTAALQQANDDPHINVIVLQGAGRAFCAGDDLKEFDSQVGSKAETRAYIEKIQDVTRQICLNQKIVIGAIHGWAVGGGLEWVINCDFVVMADDGDVPGTIMSIWLVGSFLMWLLGTPIAFLCVLLFGYIAPGRIFGR